MSYEPQTAEELELVRLGKEGKLWRIEVLVYFNASGSAIKRHELTNQTAEQIMKFRNMIFSVGLMLPVDPGKWVIVPPGDIKLITLWRQSNFFEP